MRIALVILSLILVAGCGNSTEPNSEPSDVTSSGTEGGAPGTQSSTPGSEFMPPDADKAAESLPKCSDIWVEGKTLPEDYEGCQNTGGGLDRGANYACTDGKADLIGHNDQFFARLGGQIKAYGEDEAAFSQELFEVCKPE